MKKLFLVVVALGLLLSQSCKDEKEISIEIDKVVLNKANLLLVVGSKAELKATIEPSQVLNQTLVWKSLDPTIATVDENGVVVAAKVGETIISVSTPNKKTAECKVIVISDEVSSIILNTHKETLTIGKEIQLEASIKPLTAKDKTVLWSSKDSNIATVTSEGIVKAVDNGIVEIYAKAVNGLCDTCIITVETSVASVSFADKKTTIVVGNKKEVKATVSPENASDKSLIWKSSDDKIAKVGITGEVTAIRKGSAKITATSNNGKFAEITIEVVDAVVNPTAIKFANATQTLKVGGFSTYSVEYTPSNATNTELVWSSENVEIATVDNTGKVTAVKVGEVKIIAKLKSDNSIQASFVIKVVAEDILVSSITLDVNTLEMNTGDTDIIKYSVLPINATDKAITWISSNTNVATVEDGVVTAITAGTTKITAKSSNGETAICDVTVKEKSAVIEVESIRCNKPEVEVIIGAYDIVRVSFTALPEEAIDKSLTYTSSDESICTVSVTGKINAVKEGVATITAKSNNGKTAECKVVVKRKVVEIKAIYIEVPYGSKNIGDVFNVTASFYPKNPDDTFLTWSTSDNKIATIDQKGNVTCIKDGKVKIIATAKNGVVAEEEIEINDVQITKIKFDELEFSILKGESHQFKPSIFPYEAKDQKLEWTSSSEEIATITEDGVLNAIKEGKTTITAKAKSGISATCEVIVIGEIVKVTSMEWKYTPKSILYIGEVQYFFVMFTPENATNQDVVWSSSDESIATVSSLGGVEPIKAGKFTLTATSVDNNKVSVSAEIVVSADVIEVESIEVKSYTEKEIKVGEEKSIYIKVNPKGASDKGITYTSSDNSIATTDGKYITGVAPGKVTITITAPNGVNTSYEMTVIE